MMSKVVAPPTSTVPLAQQGLATSEFIKRTTENRGDLTMKTHDTFILLKVKQNQANPDGYYNTAYNGENKAGPYVIDASSAEKVSEPSKPEPPIDRWKVIQIILIIQGLATLMPWNMFINAKSYFQDYKLVTDRNSTNVYQEKFMSYLTICSMVPSVSFSIINTFITRSSGASPIRMIVAKILMILVLIVTIVLACLDTSSWTNSFFIATLATVVLINSASSIFQNCLFGMVSILPGKYINAVIFGSNFCGILTSLAAITSIAISSDNRTSAIFYFSSAIVTLIIALITNQIFQKMPFYKFYNDQVSSQDQNIKSSNSRPPFWTIFKKIWPMCFSLWFTYSVTIVNFPNISSDVKRLSIPLSDIYWIPVCCFLNFNVFAVLGTIPSQWIRFPSAKYMWLGAILRGLVFVPYFVFCNYEPDKRNFPVYFSNDYAYLVGIAVLALTNAHITTLCFQYTPTLLKEKDIGIGGMMLNIFLFLGILCGGLLVFLYKYIIFDVGS